MVMEKYTVLNCIIQSFERTLKRIFVYNILGNIKHEFTNKKY